MMPLVLNDDPARLAQITMQGSVGRGGKNLRADVVLIQTMLNGVPKDGGGGYNLKVDGIVGPRTVGAIEQFQRASKLRIVDGRADVLGRTIVTLARLLHSRHLPAAWCGRCW
ncbi:peptidoglycan-binding domain-containing protein [Vineibacter terrae]|uniref:peptidoglycan-binding domain-containing protein n=1 Tax=Vineibacter terrae TaxID=2586908 RepID=UPI0039C932EC